MMVDKMRELLNRIPGTKKKWIGYAIHGKSSLNDVTEGRVDGRELEEGKGIECPVIKDLFRGRTLEKLVYL